MLSISASSDWHTLHPGAIIGLLELTGAGSPPSSPQLEDRKRDVEVRLRTRFHDFTRPDFLSLPVMSAYNHYYRRFEKTYHVLLQVESIVLKGKDLPAVSPLVDANFMAEVETFILTAGHDVDKLSPPVSIDVSRPGDQLVQMNGTPRALNPGDMLMRDAQAIRCSILSGQDNLSPITSATTHVLYVAYAPPGVPPAVVESHLHQLEDNIRLFSPSANRHQLRLLQA